MDLWRVIKQNPDALRVGLFVSIVVALSQILNLFIQKILLWCGAKQTISVEIIGSLMIVIILLYFLYSSLKIKKAGK
jgi:hypothetical protein